MYERRRRGPATQMTGLDEGRGILLHLLLIAVPSDPLGEDALVLPATLRSANWDQTIGFAVIGW